MRIAQAHAAIVQDQHVPAPDGWTKTFTDPRLCAAIVDRLTFNATIIETGTESYRLALSQGRNRQASRLTRPARGQIKPSRQPPATRKRGQVKPSCWGQMKPS